MRYLLLLTVGAAFGITVASADTVQIDVYKIIPNTTASSQIKLGIMTATDTPYGLLLTPQLSPLPPGIHGMHIHQNPDCGNGGMAAGAHLDPAHLAKHAGPYSDQGELGDLPALTVTNEGSATLPILAPRLKVADIKGHSLMIHAGGDTYSDTPPMGGGGARIACGVIPG